MSTPEKALFEAQKAAQAASQAIATRHMLSALLGQLSDPKAYLKEYFPACIDWSSRFIGATTIQDACQVSQARLERWLRGITPESRERKRFIDIVRMAVEGHMPA